MLLWLLGRLPCARLSLMATLSCPIVVVDRAWRELLRQKQMAPRGVTTVLGKATRNPLSVTTTTRWELGVGMGVGDNDSYVCLEYVW